MKCKKRPLRAVFSFFLFFCVLTRRHAGDTAEGADEVGIVAKARRFPRRPNAHATAQQRTGVADTELMRHALRCGTDGQTVNFPDKLAACLQKNR